MVFAIEWAMQKDRRICIVWETRIFVLFYFFEHVFDRKTSVSIANKLAIETDVFYESKRKEFFFWNFFIKQFKYLFKLVYLK